MIKLYLRSENGISAYREAWAEESRIVEHWGPLGERGETRDHPLDPAVDADEQVRAVLAGAVADGYAEIDEDDHAFLVIEYALSGDWPDDAQQQKLHALHGRLDETLGWTGLGHVDGSSAGSGTMEVTCAVVDFATAQRVVTNDLEGTEFADFARIYDEAADDDTD